MIPPINMANIIEINPALFGCINRVPIAIIIPRIPNRLPLLAVSGDDNPFKAKIKNMEDTK